MLTATEAVIMGALQGFAELFPISSLGHSVILPTLLGWQHIDERDPFFLVFLVATHFATAIVLFLFYIKDWTRIISGMLRSIGRRSIANDPYATLGWLIVVGTIPVGALGLLFQEQIRLIFLSPLSAAFFLTLNGVMLLAAERVRKKSPVYEDGVADERIARLSFTKAFFVGASQSLALIPGFSRTGASIAGGLLAGLSHEDAVRFSFLLATPVISAAAALKLPELWGTSEAAVTAAVVGALFSALFAYLSVRFLTRYFRIENHTLTPFGVYCMAAGAGALAFFLL